MNLRMLEYWAWMKRNFRKKEEGPFGVSCFVIYLSRRRFLDDPGGVDEDNRLGTETRFRYRVLKLWEMDPQTVLGLETPALAPLAPLMKGADPAALVIESRRKIVDADEVPDHKKDDL